MNKKQKEALVLAMLEKGESYRDIAQKANVSPNTIKAISNRAGLDETTSVSSRAFELYVQQKTPVEVAIELNLEAEKAINYYHDYFKLLCITEFTRVYLQIKDNPWPFVDLVKLVQNSGMSDREVIELLRIANRHLPRIRLEYDRVKEEINLSKAELNSWKAELNNTARLYQFVDRNIALKKREGELQHSVNEFEAKESELEETTTNSNQHVAEFQETNADLEMEQEIVILMNDLSTTTPSNITNSYHQNENETFHYPSRVEPSAKTLIFDKDLF
jgi:hypothetical protein